MTAAAARAVRAVLPTLGRTATTNRHSAARLSQRRVRRVVIRPTILGYPLELAATRVDLVRFWPGRRAAGMGVPGPTRAAGPTTPGNKPVSSPTHRSTSVSNGDSAMAVNPDLVIRQA